MGLQGKENLRRGKQATYLQPYFLGVTRVNTVFNGSVAPSNKVYTCMYEF